MRSIGTALYAGEGRRVEESKTWHLLHSRAKRTSPSAGRIDDDEG
jgi:hypothetical protein